MKSINQPFSKTIFKLALLAVFLFSFSCSKEAVGDPAEALSAVNASAKKEKEEVKERPWKIESAGTFQVIGTSDDCKDADKPLTIILVGSGNASHIGLYRVDIIWCTNVDADLASEVNFIDGTLTAANGDTISFISESFNGESVDYIVTGGSGRFEDASGAFNLATYEFSFDQVTFSGSYANEGGGYIVY